MTAVEVDGVGVQYDDAVHTFDDQVEIEGLTGSVSEGGDSGSVIWRSSDRAPLGLLFAGSSTGGSAGGGVTFANPLGTVLATLGVEWVAGVPAPAAARPVPEETAFQVSVPLDAQPILLGRGADATIRLDDDYVSTRHARFVPHGEDWFIEDLGSTNGTYIGSQRITSPMAVAIGVQVRVGKTIAELKK